jgi:hypothetical protein
LVANLFLPAVTTEMSDCGGVGAPEMPGMSIEGAAESCTSILGGAGGEVGGQEQRRAGNNGVEPGVFLYNGARLIKILLRLLNFYSSNRFVLRLGESLTYFYFSNRFFGIG